MARDTVRKDPATPPAPEHGDEETTETEATNAEPTVKDLMQRIEGQSRLLGKLSSIVDKYEKEKAKPAEPEAEKSLTERQRKLEAEWTEKTKKARDRAVKQTIAGALMKEGINDPELAKRQANYLKAEFADRIAVNDDDDSVLIDDAGTQVGIDKFLHAYLQTAEGNWLLPQKRPPNDKSAAKGSGITSGMNKNEDGKILISQSDYRRGQFSKAVLTEIAKGNFEITPDE